MDCLELNTLKQWFDAYVRSFYTEDSNDRRNVALKEEHTHRVCGIMTEISRSLSFDEGRTALAEAIALFHDVGRFPQYREYRTFNDRQSTNHAALGAKVLIENNVLGNVQRRERDIAIRAVTLHNVFAVPEGLDTDTLLFLRMVRDADKLDIWRVALENFALHESERPSAVGLGLPDTPGYSREVLASVLRREMVPMSSLTTLNDFKLLQLAWIYDLNFDRSLELVGERGYVDKIAAMLPAVDEIRKTIDVVREYVDGKVKKG